MGINKTSTHNGITDFTTYNYFVIYHALISMHTEVFSGVSSNNIKMIQADAWKIAMELPSTEKVEESVGISIHELIEVLNPKSKTDNDMISEERIELFKGNVRDCYDKNKVADPGKIEALYGKHVSELLEAVEKMQADINQKKELINELNRELGKERKRSYRFKRILKEFSEASNSAIRKFA